MKNLKKIGALLLALVMVLATATAFGSDPSTGGNGGTTSAAATLTDGEIGGSSTFKTDNPAAQSKSIILKKELTAYNISSDVKAPTISYTYTVTAGGQVSITDATTDHANSTAVTVTTKPGIIPNVSVTGSADGTANAAATAAASATSVANTISWSPATTLEADTDGEANYQNLTLDFSKVVFTAAGVYRYVITETPPTSYGASGVTETTATTNAHVRYLDVYVKPAGTITSNGTIAADWEIYGYVCVVENETITDDGDTKNTGAVKTNGFVAGTNDGTAYTADSYYTYNVTISKTVTNDAFAKATHAFPFTVLFTNSAITKAVDISSSTTGTVGGSFTDPASGTFDTTDNTIKGIVTIKDNSSIKYIGIPAGTTVEVYETNDMTGVTYQVTTVVDSTTSTTDDTTDVAVTSGSAPTEASAQATTKAAYQSTKATFTPAVNADDDVDHTIAVDNNLQMISPTGYVARIAPYALMLAAGITLLVIFLKRRKPVEEDE